MWKVLCVDKTPPWLFCHNFAGRTAESAICRSISGFSPLAGRGHIAPLEQY
jgi:hypothetical protein